MKCTCKQGSFLCPEAERLWANVRRFAVRFDKKSESAFKKALEKYNKHFS